MRAFLSKSIRFFRQPIRWKLYIFYRKFGFPTIEIIFAIVVYFIKNKKHNLMPNLKRGFQNHYLEVKINNNEQSAIMNRIINSYLLSKTYKKNVKLPYQTGARYQNSINTHFRPLLKAIENRDITSLKEILENFQRSSRMGGMGTSGEEYLKAKHNLFYKYMYINRWCNYKGKLDDIKSKSYKLNYSTIGNPAGILINGSIIHPEAIRFSYKSIEICNLLKDINLPIICEIGSGSGGQAYKIINDFQKPLKYILLDIPEVLVFASYFLLLNYPSKRIYLYGENDFNEDTINNNDIILLPNFMLPCLGTESVDLFFNDCSFSEMEKITVEEYFRQIERICRKYIMHINHNAKSVWYFNGIRTENLPSTEIFPNENKFKRIYQHYRIFQDRNEKVFYFFLNIKHYMFLYERIR